MPKYCDKDGYYVRIVEPFKGIDKTVKCDDEEFLLLKSSTTISKLPSNRVSDTKTTKARSKVNKNDKKKSKKDGRNSKKSKHLAENKLPELSLWVDFEALVNWLICFTIFSVPSSFSHWYCITNVSKHFHDSFVPNKTAPKIENKIFYQHETILKISNNEPIYIYVDNVDEDPLMFQVEIFGHCELLEKSADDELVSINTIRTNRLCHLRTCPFYVKYDNEIYAVANHKSHKKRPLAKYVLTHHKWYSKHIGDSLLIGASLGQQSHTIAAGPGKCYFFWAFYTL